MSASAILHGEHREHRGHRERIDQLRHVNCAVRGEVNKRGIGLADPLLCGLCVLVRLSVPEISPERCPDPRPSKPASTASWRSAPFPLRPSFLSNWSRRLDRKVNLLAAKAAALAGEFGRVDLAPQLAAAFSRFIADAARSDKGCRALKAIAKALFDLGAPPEAGEVFLAGIRHVQKEGGFGPPEDVAAELRGICALGLVKIGYPDVLVELADLLTDAEPEARAGAAGRWGSRGRTPGAAAAVQAQGRRPRRGRDGRVHVGAGRGCGRARRWRSSDGSSSRRCRGSRRGRRWHWGNRGSRRRSSCSAGNGTAAERSG